MLDKVIALVLLVVLSVRSSKVNVYNVVNINGEPTDNLTFEVEVNSRRPEGTNGTILFVTNASGEHFAIKQAKGNYENRLQLENEFNAFVHLFGKLKKQDIKTNGFPEVFYKGVIKVDGVTTPVIVMEKLETNLSEHAKLHERKEPHAYISEQDTINFAMQLLEILAILQRCGVVHADVKPSNVMVTANKTLKLIDFGIAKFENSRRELTGSPWFMSSKDMTAILVLNFRLDFAAAMYSIVNVAIGDALFGETMHSSPSEDEIAIQKKLYRPVWRNFWMYPYNKQRFGTLIDAKYPEENALRSTLLNMHKVSESDETQDFKYDSYLAALKNTSCISK